MDRRWFGKGFWKALGVRLEKDVTQFIVRLPGFFLLELWMRSQNGNPILGGGSVISQQVGEKFFSFFQVGILLDFLHARELDQTAVNVLNFSTVFLSLVLLLLPVSKLVALYVHAASFSLVAVAHYMSMRYVKLEQELGGEIILDELTKLERHGFHFLAQALLALCVSCLMRLRSPVLRATLAIYTSPVIFRLCGFPLGKLHEAHNFACSYAMLLICFYLLSQAPSILLSIRRLYKQVKACFVVRGALYGCFTLWKRLRLPLQLCFFWACLFLTQFYTISSKGKQGLAFLVLKSLSESTATPLSLVALAAFVSYGSRLILYSTKCFLYGSSPPSGVPDHQSLLHAGYAEGCILLLLCFQTGILTLNSNSRALLLGLVLFIVLSTIFQSLFDVLEPHLLSLGASGRSEWSPVLSAIVVSLGLFFSPILMVWGITQLFPVDLWLMIIISNCLLTSLQTLSAVTVCLLFWIEARSSQPWEHLDDMIYYSRAYIRGLEFLLAVFVISFGLWETLMGRWSWISISVLTIHCYYNVYRRLQSGWESFKLRREAASKLQFLGRARREQLLELQDVCAICVGEMEEARMTPCGHFFHSSCLKKWLFVRLSCPLCHLDLSVLPAKRSRRHANSDAEEGYSSEDDTPQPDEEMSDTDYSFSSSENE